MDKTLLYPPKQDGTLHMCIQRIYKNGRAQSTSTELRSLVEHLNEQRVSFPKTSYVMYVCVHYPRMHVQLEKSDVHGYVCT